MNKIELNNYSISFSHKVRDWAKANIYKDFTLGIKLDWNPNRSCSRGGIYADGPGINMAMYHAYRNTNGETYRFREYASFDADPHIGGFYSTDPYHKLDCIILHEVAHALQFFSYKKNNVRCKPHGPVFKNFYKRLRTEFLNSRLPEQSYLQADYDEFVYKINKRASL